MGSHPYERLVVVIPTKASIQDARTASRGLSATSAFPASTTEDVQSRSNGFLVKHVNLIAILDRYGVAIYEILHRVAAGCSILPSQLVPKGGCYHAKLLIDFHLLAD